VKELGVARERFIRDPSGVDCLSPQFPVVARLRRGPPANFRHASGVLNRRYTSLPHREAGTSEAPMRV
jgi:hypothetical protein